MHCTPLYLAFAVDGGMVKHESTGIEQKFPRQTPRARLRLLSRAGEGAPVPLFLPLVLALAAGIEALDVAEFLRNSDQARQGAASAAPGAAR